jgi:hypothetical protein
LEVDVGKAERRAAIFAVIENQLRLNDPPETRIALDRLMGEGYTRNDAFHLIGSAIGAEIFQILGRHEQYDRERYVARLLGLPDTSWLYEGDDEPVTVFERWKKRYLP